MASPQIISSRFATQERWLKLYRKIHNLFMKDEFIHVVDYNQMVTEMNARITLLETALQVELAKIQVGLAAHIHNAPQAPGGILPTTPPAAPPYTTGYSPTKPVVPVTVAMKAFDAALQATGPAMAPIPATISADDAQAAIQARTDIGV